MAWSALVPRFSHHKRIYAVLDQDSWREIFAAAPAECSPKSEYQHYRKIVPVRLPRRDHFLIEQSEFTARPAGAIVWRYFMVYGLVFFHIKLDTPQEKLSYAPTQLWVSPGSVMFSGSLSSVGMFLTNKTRIGRQAFEYQPGSQRRSGSPEPVDPAVVDLGRHLDKTTRMLAWNYVR